MSYTNQVKQYGRICYVNPNDLISEQNAGDGIENGLASYNFTQPYEDYCISVDLQVIKPNRNGFAVSSDGSTNVEFTTHKLQNNTISFFSGTSGYMTNIPGTLSYADLLNGKTEGINENLGITNIHISYDSYFYPQVTINFTDIRGTALMTPNEEETLIPSIEQQYYSEFLDRAYNPDTEEEEFTMPSISLENFFSAVFAFPSPEFKLSVKGFYGKKVEYSLMVQDFRASFNNSTGNFDVVIKFIGKMYGVYTDIPMSLLLIAPYCTYGNLASTSEDNAPTTIWEEKNFTLNGKSMPTLLEVNERVRKATSNLDIAVPNSISSEYETFVLEQDLLNEIRRAYNALVNYVKNNFEHKVGFTANNLFYFNGENVKWKKERFQDSDGIVYYGRHVLANFSVAEGKTVMFNVLLESLYELINRYNELNRGNPLPYLEGLVGSKLNLSDIELHVIYLNGGNHNYIEVWGTLFGTQDAEDLKNTRTVFNNYPEFKKQLLRYRSETPAGKLKTIAGVILSGKDLYNAIDDRLSKVSTQIQESLEVHNQLVNSQLYQILGFNPSIQNIFKILMAHLDCFMELFNKFINNVTASNRSLDEYGLTFDATDVNSDGFVSETESFLPPFPILRNKNTNEFAYPTIGVTNGKEMEEVVFINSLLNSNFSFLSELEKMRQIARLDNENAAEFLPSCLTDFAIIKNPYEYVFNRGKSIDWLMTFFGYRCIMKFMLRGNKNPGLSSSAFGIAEAYNFVRYHPYLDEHLISAISDRNLTAENFILFLKGHVNIPFNNLCYKRGNQFEYFLSNSNSGFTLDFMENNYPAALRLFTTTDDDENVFQTFWDDASSSAKKTKTFLSSDRTQAPSAYINLYKPGENVNNQNRPNVYSAGLINDWLKEIQNADLSILGISESDCAKVKDGILSETTCLSPSGEEFYGDNIYFGQINNFNSNGTEAGDFVKVRISNGTVANYYLDKKKIVHYKAEFKDNNGKPLNAFSSNYKGVPVFFALEYNDKGVACDIETQAAIFLMSIPHNMKTFGFDFYNNGGLITLPKVTALYLGMWMSHLVNDNNDQFENFINKFAKRYCDKSNTYANYLINAICYLLRGDDDSFLVLPPVRSEYWTYLDYVSEGGDDKIIVLERKDIYGKLIESSDNEHQLDTELEYYAGETGEYYYHLDDNHVTVWEWLKHIKKNYSKYLKKDILGLITDFKEWAKDETPTGFSYIYKAYALEESESYYRAYIYSVENIDPRTGMTKDVNTSAMVYYNHDLSDEHTHTEPAIDRKAYKGGDNEHYYRRLHCTITGNTVCERFANLCETSGMGPSLKGRDHYTEGYTIYSKGRISLRVFNAWYKAKYLNPNDNSNTAFSNRYAACHFDNTSMHLVFNTQFYAYNSLYQLLKEKYYLLIPYRMMQSYTTGDVKGAGEVDFGDRTDSEGEELGTRATYRVNTKFNADDGLFNKVSVANFTDAFNSFITVLRNVYTTNSVGENNNSAEQWAKYDSDIVTQDAKTSLYLTLKNLYDKHLTNLPNSIGRYRLNEENCEFNRCYFIDTYYNNLGDELKINSNTLCSIIEALTEGYESGNGEGSLNSTMSIYEFMSLICEKHGLLLLAMPFFNGYNNKNNVYESLQTMFTPIPYNTNSIEDTITGPSYICYYPHQPSQHLDNKKSQYRNDALDIDDISGVNVNHCNMFLNTNDNHFVIPTFAVEYGSQKQSIFKNVNINMENPQITEASVSAQFNLLNDTRSRGEGQAGIIFEGQNLYKIYSNYSYTCQVEMMGCSQIQPLMYFQLNNIPMFKGIYQIIQVEHNVTPGDMSTTFKGVRINRTKMPMIKGGIATVSLSDIIKNRSERAKALGRRAEAINFNNDAVVLDGGASLSHGGLPVDVSYNVMREQFGNYVNFASVDMGIDKNAEKSFDLLNKYLRENVYSIVNTIQINNLGIRTKITSSTRKNTGSSDHNISTYAGDNLKDIRKEEGAVSTAAGQTNPVQLTELGCAIDMQAEKIDGTQDDQVATITLFSLIALYFTDSISQLVWEYKNEKEDTAGGDYIDNCIHYNAYGRFPDGTVIRSGNKAQIFISLNKDGKSYPADNIHDDETDGKALEYPPSNIPPSFIKIMYNMGRTKFNKISWNNWSTCRTPLTYDHVVKWCEEMELISPPVSSNSDGNSEVVS